MTSRIGIGIGTEWLGFESSVGESVVVNVNVNVNVSGSLLHRLSLYLVLPRGRGWGCVVVVVVVLLLPFWVLGFGICLAWQAREMNNVE